MCRWKVMRNCVAGDDEKNGNFMSKLDLHKLSHLEDGMITQLTHCSYPFPTPALRTGFLREQKSTKMGEFK